MLCLAGAEIDGERSICKVLRAGISSSLRGALRFKFRRGFWRSDLVLFAREIV